MQKKVLVITSTPGFGDLIKQALTESAYPVTLLSSAAEAIGLVQESTFALAILDSDLEDFPFVDLIHALRKVAPGMRLVLIPPQNNNQDPQLASLDVQGFLSKPFYIPDLLDLVEKLVGIPASQEQTVPNPARPTQRAETAPAPAWLDDVSRAAQHLTGLSLGTSAQAALIVRSGQLWAYAGQLAQPAAQELASLVANYWAHEREMPPGAHRGGTKSDLARFTRLGSTGGEYMLYATSLGSGLILALAFDAETPFSKIRSQASQLARELAAPPAITLPQMAKAEQTVTPAVERKTFRVPPTSPAPRKPVHDIPDLHEDWLKLDNLAKELYTDAEEDEAENEVEPATPVAQQETKPAERPEVKAPAQVVPTWDTLRGDVMNPVAPGMVYLVYACVIIPRLPQHHLAGDLVERLMEWVGQLCLAFGWRLEYISVAAEYTQWVVNVPPTTSPSYLMRILRQHTSKRIFADFPDLARDNPSGDFWAPGYLIMSSPTPPPEPIVRDFIQQIRRHQGAFNSFPPHIER